jgi:hypothetical protein
MKTATGLLALSLAGGILATTIIAVHADSVAGATRALTPKDAHGPIPAALAAGAATPARSAALPTHALKRLGSIALLAPGAADGTDHPIRDVSAFTIDDRGRFGFMIGCGCNRTLIVVDRDGTLVRSLDLPKPPDTSQSSRFAAWLGGDRWIVTSSSDRAGTKSSAIWVDMGSGTVTAVAGFDAPRIVSLAPSGDGGFVALTSVASATGTQRRAVIAYDRNAAVLWKSPAFDADDSFGSRNIAVTTSRHTVVLVANTLRVYAVDGQLARVVQLPGTTDAKDSVRFTGLHADTLGGVFVTGSDRHHGALHISDEGKTLGAFTPAFPDNDLSKPNGDVQRGPDGRVWTSDSYAFLQLDSQGRVVREVGDRFDPNHLGSIGQLTVNSNGWVFARDKRTRSIHVFDDSGRFDHVDKAIPADTGDDDDYLEPMSATDTGDVYVSGIREAEGHDPRIQRIHYAADGSKASIESDAVVGDGGMTRNTIAQPGTGNHWDVQFDAVVLVDPHGKQLRRIDRDTNGDTLEVSGNAVVAPDGSIAVASRVQHLFLGMMPAGSSRQVVLTISREGIPLHTATAPAGWEPWGSSIAFDGTHVAFVVANESSEDKRSIVVANLQGGTRYRFEPPSLDSDAKIFLLERNGASELWIYDGKGTIERYAVI